MYSPINFRGNLSLLKIFRVFSSSVNLIYSYLTKAVKSSFIELFLRFLSNLIFELGPFNSKFFDVFSSFCFNFSLHVRGRKFGIRS